MVKQNEDCYTFRFGIKIQRTPKPFFLSILIGQPRKKSILKMVNKKNVRFHFFRKML